jgi:hypothetical protein
MKYILNKLILKNLQCSFKLRRRRLEKFSGESTLKTQNSNSQSSSSVDTNDKQVSTQLSNELASKYWMIHLLISNIYFLCLACQIDSQQINSIDDTNMDIGELLTIEMNAANGEQRFWRECFYLMNQ